MAKYRKKPVVIEAVQFDGTHEGGSTIIGWMKTYGTVGGAIGEAILSIATLEGTMTASPGDWIIKGVQGEFYPCKPEIFEATYEPEEGAALATAQPEAISIDFSEIPGKPDKPEAKPEGVEVGELRVNNAAGENSWKLWDYDLTPQVPPGTHKLYVHLATRQAQGGGEDGR